MLLSAKCPRPPGRRCQQYILEHWLNITRFQHEINQEFINSARIFLGYEFVAGRIWKGDILTDLEDLEKLGASDICPRRINAKEVLISQKGEEFIFPVADGTAKLSGGDYEFRETILRREPTIRSEDFSRELHGEPGES